MKKKVLAIMWCLIMGMTVGCSAQKGPDLTEADAVVSTETVQEENMSETETWKEETTEEAASAETESVRTEAGEEESAASENSAISEEEIEEVINSISITYSSPDFEMTEELEEKVMPKLKEAIRYIGTEWEKAASGEMILTKIHMQTGTSDGQKAVHGFTLSYTSSNQPEDINFTIKLINGRSSQIVKYWTGNNRVGEEIPIDPEIK